MLDSAAAATWRIFAAPARVPIERAGAVFTVENNAGIAWLFQPCPARYSVEFNVIAGVYPGARAAAITGEFCAHAFDHLAPSSNRIFLRKGIAKPVKLDNSFSVIFGLLSYMRFMSSNDNPLIDLFNV